MDVLVLFKCVLFCLPASSVTGRHAQVNSRFLLCIHVVMPQLDILVDEDLLLLKNRHMNELKGPQSSLQKCSIIVFTSELEGKVKKKLLYIYLTLTQLVLQSIGGFPEWHSRIKTNNPLKCAHVLLICESLSSWKCTVTVSVYAELSQIKVNSVWHISLGPYVSCVSKPGQLNLKAIWPSDCEPFRQTESN